MQLVCDLICASASCSTTSNWVSVQTLYSATALFAGCTRCFTAPTRSVSADCRGRATMDVGLPTSATQTSRPARLSRRPTAPPSIYRLMARSLKIPRPQTTNCRLYSGSVFTARCTIVQSAVLRSHVVCLSVCDVGGS